MAEENDEFLRLLANSGWNQARAARELGTTMATVSRYVTGKIVPSIPVLRLFAERLGETLLLPGSPYSATSLGDSPRWLANWESDAIYLLRRLDPEPRAKLIEAVRSMVESMAGRERYRRGRPAEAPPPAGGVTVEAVVDRLLQSGNTALTAADVAAEFLAQSEQRGASTQPRTPERAADPATQSPKPGRKPRTR